MSAVLAPTPARRRRRVQLSLVLLEALLALGAFAGAVGLVTGGIDLGAAAGDLPFGSAAFGGIALALINGVLPTAVIVGALRARPWAARGHLFVGVALMGWIVVQVGFLGVVVWLHVVYFLYGLAIAALAVWHRRLAEPA